MIAALFFVWFFAACVWTVNALRRPTPPHRKFPPLWLPGMLISELAPLYFLLRALVALVFVSLGALGRTIGVAGLVLFAFSEIGLLVVMARTIRGAAATGHSPPWWSVFKVYERLPTGVTKTIEIPYWDSLTLDIYAKPGTSTAPALVYVHPGSWMRGRPGRQARALFYRLAVRGWVVFDIRYPLSPDATFPEHLVGVKKAVASIRERHDEFGVDPDQIVVSGGSSGAHLAALAALTPNDPELQPGFEAADTSLAACVPFYGIFDLLVRNPTRYDWPFIARHVMKASRDDDPDLYSMASPLDRVSAGAPPFLVVHGEFDSIVLPAESEQFAAALRAAGADATYFEVPGAQHGFDAIASLRTRAVAQMTVAWIESRITSVP